MKRCLLILLLLIGPPAWAEQLKGVKGADDRREVPAASYPWSAVGRLNNGQGGHCSGLLIGPKLVVTAAHCLWNKKTRKPLRAESLTFVAGYDRGNYLAASDAVKAVVAPEWTFGVPYGPGPASHDWALLILERPLGDMIGSIALGADPNKSSKLAAIGYGQDRAHIPTAHLGCHVTGKFPQGVLTHDCDAVHGDSGGPVLTWVDGEPRLSAMHVATFTMKDGTILGGAVAVSEFAAEARKQGAAAASKAGAMSQSFDGTWADQLK